MMEIKGGKDVTGIWGGTKFSRMFLGMYIEQRMTHILGNVPVKGLQGKKY